MLKTNKLYFSNAFFSKKKKKTKNKPFNSCYIELSISSSSALKKQKKKNRSILSKNFHSDEISNLLQPLIVFRLETAIIS